MSGPAIDAVIPRLCACDAAATEEWCSDGRWIIACGICGAEAVSLGGGVPAFVRDGTLYRVSVELSPALLKAHLGLIKRKTGLETPELLALARAQRRVTLVADRAIAVHYALRELAAAGLPVGVDPPYPHDVDRND
jgi:hypothetical protein